MRPELRGKNVVVYGLGKSGLGAVRLLNREGARVRVVDSKSPEEVRTALGDLKAEVGAPEVSTLSSADLVVVSPGVPLSNPELVAARQKGVPVWGEVELSYRFLASRSPAAKFVGITGTNGKSTTTALTGELLRAAGQKVFVGGNLGTALSDAALSDEECNSYVVELSSFQLEGIEKMRLHAAAFLNLQPDHIDRYPDMQAYAAAKARIWMNQVEGDVAIVNADDPAVMEAALPARKILAFSLKNLQARAHKTADGFEMGDSKFVLRNKALRGAHNVQNAMAAALLASHAGADAASIQKGLDSYPGLPHRMEFVRTLNGVEWINDSKATNVDSSLVALAAFKEGVWLIAGGKGKGAPYTPMVEASKGRVRGVLTIGNDAKTIESAYRGVIDVIPCENLRNAVSKARELAKSGDTVLLSPACASYDQFKNFEDRGEQFKAMVRAL
ncbi:MAG: UDP-N-acetylmuramoyl-L-alanine--D-glutamate ligase [Myxococcaceae bacterium]